MPGPVDRNEVVGSEAVGKRAARSGLDLALVAAVTGWSAFWAWRTWPVRGLSWHFFLEGGHWLAGGSGLAVYAQHPELQVGPLALLVAAALQPLPDAVARDLALVTMAIAGPLLLAALAPLVARPRRLRRLLLVALLLVPGWTVLAVRWGHLDDVLAMAAAVGAVRALAACRPVLTGLALAAAVAAKPWALGFVPLLLALPTGTLLGALAVAAGTAAAWLPFVLLHPRTLGALHPPVALVDSSGLHTLGVRGREVPAWGRTAQLLLAPAAATAAALAGRWPGVLLVAVAVRLVLDPQDNAYYLGSALLAAAVLDLLGSHRTIPWATLLTAMALWQPFVHDYARRLATTSGPAHWWFAHPTQVGVLHLLWAAAMLGLVLTGPRAPEPGSLPRRG